jgi:hypothetical protein
LSQAADDRYFALQHKQAPEKEWQAAFSRARLLRSMAIIFGAVPGEDAADAVYELTRCQADPSGIILSIESEISAVLQDG